jgi:cell wall-associated NlpC family hydrolase
MRANVAVSTPAGNESNERRAFLACLHLKLGYPYVQATAGPWSFDCSGLVDFCYREAAGREIPGGRGSWLQCQQAGRELGQGEPLAPGDLLCFLDGQHVGIYTDNDTMINALNEDEGVRENDITTPYWTSNFDRARRLWES